MKNIHTAASRRVAAGLAALLMIVLPALPVLAQEASLGTTDFPNSGAPAAQADFVKGLLLLHSFEYEDAAEAFRAAQASDPGFAMAYWGEAMTYNHPLWFQQDLEQARATLDRLAATPQARLKKAQTPREQAYMAAAHILYGEGDKEDRDDAFAEAMRRLHHTYPEDLDAAAFYALSLLGTSHEGRDFATYMKAAAIVEEVFARNPVHPGAAHYLIHSYDDPIHAPLGLRAARAYSEIAPAASHALHMPSHIFTALGMWDDVARMNEAAWAAADERRVRKGLGVGARSFHALYWLANAYLQQGRYQEARQQLATMTTDAQQSGSGGARSHLARVRAAYLVDTRQWDSPAANIEVNTEGLGIASVAADRFATGMAAVKAGRFAAAEAALAAMPTAQDDDDGPSATAAAIMAQELEALLAMSQGQREEALALMKQATAAEAVMPFDFGPPMPVKPSHELMGEMLMDIGRPEEAVAQFEQALVRAPQRALSLLGLARAAAAAGQQERATHAYAALRDLWHRADDDLPEHAEIKQQTQPAPGGGR